ncbi:neprilysin-2-like isoform X2 [Wyeomyia smithii]|uniref:neprilysin-2-like isoform X2 n=1 Tax=Wyeomyia smithii TaxID=174621 RepID=UPI00246821AC|nr:neprilysin-2-like isoform X2 [Wyeomyia smithii]
MFNNKRGNHRAEVLNETHYRNDSWWKRRTTHEKILTCISTICASTVAVLLVSLFFVLINCRAPESHTPLVPEALTSLQNKEDGPIKLREARSARTKLCLNEGCVHSASNMLRRMDLSVKPCDDFYEYACGQFVNETYIPDNKVSMNTFSLIRDQLKEQLRMLVSGEVVASEAKPFKITKQLFAKCMNKTHIEKSGNAPLEDILNTMGGWPVLQAEQWNADSWSWEKSVKDFRQHGYSISYILGFSVGSDSKNTSYRTIKVDQASLGVNREYLIKGLNHPIVSAYYSYMVDIAVLLGANVNRAKVELYESLAFEIALANISLPKEQRRNITALYNPMTVKEFHNKYPYTDWIQYFNAIFEGTGISVGEEEIINVAVPSYVEQLGPLLRSTSKRTLANYVMWRATGSSIFSLTEVFRERQLKYSTVVSGKQELEQRWQECVDVVSNGLPISVGALYIRKHFREEAKSTAMDMVRSIKAAFIDILEKVSWMDEITRLSALDKVEAMATHIGFPKELMDIAKITEHYADLHINSNDSYLKSILHLNKFQATKSFQKLRLPVNKTEWIRHARPAVVNAFYSPIENSIQFPAGILQDHFFAYDRPKYLNYGAIGWVIGHEITHGFDDKGRQYDKNGNLYDWWQPTTKKAYLEKARCVIEQYGNYTEPDVKLNLNGVSNQGENIADNGGIKEAYYAYRNWAQKHGTEPQLPGLDLSPEQMFWLSAAQTWCSVYRPEAMRKRITTGVHSPGRFRVIGPFSNMHEFAKDFGCPTGAKMNPDRKCEVW